MKKIFINWLLPVFIAIGIVITGRFVLFEIVVLKERNMANELHKGDKLVFSKIFSPKRDQIVHLIHYPVKNKDKIARIAGMPGDTLTIFNSIIYINNRRKGELKAIVYTYTCTSHRKDSAIYFFKHSNLEYDNMLARLGLYKFDADFLMLKKIKSEKIFENLKRTVEEPNVNLQPVLASENVIYWNKDNFGPIFIPRAGFKIEMNYRNFIIYKHLIKSETGYEPEMKSEGFLLSGKPIKSYIIKKNYYFLMNDMRSNSSDSRRYGLVPENKITSSYLFKMPF